MDGLVSTGIQIPYTILKIIFANKKKNLKYFIHIFFDAVENGKIICMLSSNHFFNSSFLTAIRIVDDYNQNTSRDKNSIVRFNRSRAMI